MSITLLGKCGDKRLLGRERQLSDYFAKLDRNDPYRLLIPGAELTLCNTEVVYSLVRPYLKLGATHVHIEGHCGIEPSVQGCGAYGLRFIEGLDEQSPGALYLPEEELADHRNDLALTPTWLEDGLKHDPLEYTYSLSLFRHDANGAGKAEMIMSTRDLPDFPFEWPIDD